MTDRIAFSYGEFYDYPRMLRLLFNQNWYFLSSPFDEERDDYPDYYDVYLLPFHSEAEFQSNPNYWINLRQYDYLGRIPIADVGLDETRRKSIDAEAFETWLSFHRQESNGE